MKAELLVQASELQDVVETFESLQKDDMSVDDMVKLVLETFQGCQIEFFGGFYFGVVVWRNPYELSRYIVTAMIPGYKNIQPPSWGYALRVQATKEAFQHKCHHRFVATSQTEYQCPKCNKWKENRKSHRYMSL